MPQTPSTEPNPLIPRPEHPRPDFRREPWINLNGRWRFTFDPQNVGEQQRWYRVPHPSVAANLGALVEDPFEGDIIVPFPWESRLSEVGATDYKGAAWYQRVHRGAGGMGGGGPRQRPARCPGPAERRGHRNRHDGGRRERDLAAQAVSLLRRGGLARARLGQWALRRRAQRRLHAVRARPLPLRPARAARDADRPRLGCLRRRYAARQADGELVHATPAASGRPSGSKARPAAHLARVHVTPHLESSRRGVRIAVAGRSGRAGQASSGSASPPRDGAFPAVEQTVDARRRGSASTRWRSAVPHPTALVAGRPAPLRVHGQPGAGGRAGRELG